MGLSHIGSTYLLSETYVYKHYTRLTNFISIKVDILNFFKLQLYLFSEVFYFYFVFRMLDNCRTYKLMKSNTLTILTLSYFSFFNNEYVTEVLNFKLKVYV